MHPQTVYEISREVRRELLLEATERRSIVSRVRRAAAARRSAHVATRTCSAEDFDLVAER
ncbi:hypothetical protein Bcav_2654 [Beutenbergia cavernae DSM 12333]|uniref:Uncharacterized protein n=1 Tax=Beutenbergia cavernae (strain ATCC BAA-8 / DSM 12333 / CCUG 43141 / JCM 11478 / NBRC 16432 / NCIMB 13614 / HKI 0122) TaxID=471853 RepID=C5BXL6_BEUC1|nr:hypothetical protein [Beutenbergia cavernae]ACQ80899.1 hypothetical protein Bcav_2654 [Beutenbergia cavernae DSM 12333]